MAQFFRKGLADESDGGDGLPGTTSNSRSLSSSVHRPMRTKQSQPTAATTAVATAAIPTTMASTIPLEMTALRPVPSDIDEDFMFQHRIAFGLPFQDEHDDEEEEAKVSLTHEEDKQHFGSDYSGTRNEYLTTSGDSNEALGSIQTSVWDVATSSRTTITAAAPATCFTTEALGSSRGLNVHRGITSSCRDVEQQQQLPPSGPGIMLHKSTSGRSNPAASAGHWSDPSIIAPTVAATAAPPTEAASWHASRDPPLSLSTSSRRHQPEQHRLGAATAASHWSYESPQATRIRVSTAVPHRSRSVQSPSEYDDRYQQKIQEYHPSADNGAAFVSTRVGGRDIPPTTSAPALITTTTTRNNHDATLSPPLPTMPRRGIPVAIATAVPTATPAFTTAITADSQPTLNDDDESPRSPIANSEQRGGTVFLHENLDDEEDDEDGHRINDNFNKGGWGCGACPPLTTPRGRWVVAGLVLCVVALTTLVIVLVYTHTNSSGNNSDIPISAVANITGVAVPPSNLNAPVCVPNVDGQLVCRVGNDQNGYPVVGQNNSFLFWVCDNAETSSCTCFVYLGDYDADKSNWVPCQDCQIVNMNRNTTGSNTSVPTVRYTCPAATATAVSPVPAKTPLGSTIWTYADPPRLVDITCGVRQKQEDVACIVGNAATSFPVNNAAVNSFLVFVCSQVDNTTTFEPGMCNCSVELGDYYQLTSSQWRNCASCRIVQAAPAAGTLPKINFDCSEALLSSAVSSPAPSTTWPSSSGNMRKPDSNNTLIGGTWIPTMAPTIQWSTPNK